MARLGTQEQRLLDLLDDTEWRNTARIFTLTSLYRSPTSVSAALGQLARQGLVERRTTGHHNARVTEWRLLSPTRESAVRPE